MRRISTRFCLVVGFFALAFSGFMLYRTWSVTRQHMESFVASESKLALEFDLAIRDYVREKIRPEMTKRVGPDEFVPEVMSSSYISRSIFEKVHEKLPEYVIKFSSAHPRNPVNQAGREELEMIHYFEEHPGVSCWTGEIQLDGKEYLAQLSPMRVAKECLRCHGRPEDAPAQLVARYGPTAGFNRRPGEVIGLDTIAVPLNKVDAAIASETNTQLMVMVAWLILLFGSIFLVFRFLVGKRLAVLAEHFERWAHQSNGTIASVPAKGNDEIGVLASSFNSLATKLRGFHSSLEELVAQRTAALEAENAERRRAEEALKEEQHVLRQLLEIHERHQKLIACDIHDSFTQPLAGALMNLDAMRGSRLRPDRQEETAKSLERVRELLTEIIDYSRRLMTGLRPPILDDLGPVAAIESLVAENEVVGKQEVEYTHSVQFDRLAPDLETAIFRIVQEALRNAQLHSQSERVRVSLVQTGDRLRIEVEDWGVGFDPRAVDPGRFGLESIRERSRLMGGEAVVTSTPGQGTIITVDLPLQPLNSAEASFD